MVLRRALQLRRARRFEANLVWVLGSPRSGSSWLWTMLAELDDVIAVNEPQIGHHLAPFLADTPGFDARALDVDTFTMHRLQAGRSHYVFADAFRDAWLPALRDLLDTRFLAHATDNVRGDLGRTRVVLKEPNGSQGAGLLMAAQPDAHLLFLLRDGRDVVDSELAANLPGSWVSSSFPGHRGIDDAERLDFVVQSAQKWRWRTEVVLAAYEAHRGPRMLVRYEDLLDDPAAGLAGIVTWMGLHVPRAETDRIAAAHSFDALPEASRGDTAFYRSARPGAWRHNLTAEEQAVLGELLDPTLAAHGYQQG